MGTGRMEAFSDGVIAIIITIMVLELKVPHGTDLAALGDLLPELANYVLSFVYVAIYWNNHHHLLHACDRINGAIMWANMHFLFWLSLIPFVTSWVGEHREAPVPAAAYGVVLLMAGVAYLVMERQMVRENGPQSVLAEGGRQGPQGPGVADRVCRGDRARLRIAAARGPDLCARRRHVDRAGSPHRATRRLVSGNRGIDDPSGLPLSTRGRRDARALLSRSSSSPAEAPALAGPRR
jgi:uncharacterized membrane protein